MQLDGGWTARGHGGVYDAVNSGDVVIARLKRAIGAVPLPRWDGGRIRLQTCGAVPGIARLDSVVQVTVIVFSQTTHSDRNYAGV